MSERRSGQEFRSARAIFVAGRGHPEPRWRRTLGWFLFCNVTPFPSGSATLWSRVGRSFHRPPNGSSLIQNYYSACRELFAKNLKAHSGRSYTPRGGGGPRRAAGSLIKSVRQPLRRVPDFACGWSLPTWTRRFFLRRCCCLMRFCESLPWRSQRDRRGAPSQP
jgi:hypothetical protein